jgi:hypothetical protein
MSAINVIRIALYEAETCATRAGGQDRDAPVFVFFVIGDVHLARALAVVTLEPVLVGVIARTVDVYALHHTSFPQAQHWRAVQSMSYPSDLTDEQWELLEPVFR